MEQRISNFNIEQSPQQLAQEALSELEQIVCKPYHPRGKTLALRRSICTEIVKLLNAHYQRGDIYTFKNYLSKKGIEISARNFQRIIASDSDHHIAVLEKTSFLALRHLFSFYEIEPEQAETICLRIASHYHNPDKRIISAK